MDVTLHRADRHARDAGDLLIREADRIAKDDDDALIDRESSEGLGDLSAQVAERGEPGGIGFVSSWAVFEFERLGPADALTRGEIAARIDDEPVKPRAELGVAAELAQASTELDERLLGGVSRVLEIDEKVSREALDARRVPLHERVKRAVIASFRPCHQIRIAQTRVGKEPFGGETGTRRGRLHSGS